MKTIRFIKEKILKRACVYTVFIDSIILAVSSGSDITPAITAYVFFAILLFSLALAAADLAFMIPKINTVTKTIIHFVLCTSFTMLFLRAALQYDESKKLTQLGVDNKMYLIGLIIFIMIYTVLISVKFIISAIVRKNEEKKNSEYQNMF